jgi:hypothetical protein
MNADQKYSGNIYYNEKRNGKLGKVLWKLTEKKYFLGGRENCFTKSMASRKINLIRIIGASIFSNFAELFSMGQLWALCANAP